MTTLNIGIEFNERFHLIPYLTCSFGKSVFIQLPYLGNYDVEVSVWDLYNHCCKQYTKALSSLLLIN